MNHRTETNGDDDGQGLHAVADPAIVSQARRREGFEPVGEAVHAVVMKLQTRLPRLKVLSQTGKE